MDETSTNYLHTISILIQHTEFSWPLLAYYGVKNNKGISEQFKFRDSVHNYVPNVDY